MKQANSVMSLVFGDAYLKISIIPLPGNSRESHCLWVMRTRMASVDISEGKEGGGNSGGENKIVKT